MISLLRQNNFAFSPDNYEFSTSRSLFKILGGNTPLESIFDHDYYKFIPSLKKKNIIFLEQLTSLDGKDLLDCHSIHQQCFLPINDRRSRNPAKWYDILRPLITTSTSTSLLSQYIQPVTSGYKGWKLSHPSTSNLKKEYIIIWIQPLKRTILGKFLKNLWIIR